MTKKSEGYYKYIIVDEEIKKWGMYLTGVGHINIPHHVEYPIPTDPSHHYFQYSVGRRLTDYQIIYIIRGEGVFESEATGFRKVNAGDAFILFPHIWHRFRPNINTGWEEFWVEFNGDMIKHYRTNGFLNPATPLMRVGVQEELAAKYLEIVKAVKEDKPGFQYVTAGQITQILGILISSLKYQRFEGKPIENKIRQAKVILLENLQNPISQKDISDTIGLGYAVYRKKFKEYTGFSPNQYKLNLVIDKAKELLITSSQSYKEIAHFLGFDSTDYFFRLFKQKTGITPTHYRTKNENRFMVFRKNGRNA
jgi:AraC-like DNA-binding protein